MNVSLSPDEARHLLAHLALSNAGDVSGTGSDQLFVGAWSNDDNGTSSGAAYVVP